MVGQVVIHGVFGKGTVISIRTSGGNSYIDIEFAVGVKSFPYPDAFVRHLRMEDPEKQKEVEAEIQRIADEKRRLVEEELERQRREAEERERQRREAEERAREERERQRNTNRREHDEPSFERTTDGRMCFIVFQNQTFDVESRGNYLWAPTSDARGVWCHYWKRLTQVRAGDIIFHCRGGEIQAVSVAQGSSYSQIAPSDPVYNANWGKMGMQLNSDYSLILNTIHTSSYRAQIMATYPAGSHYAPFDRNGDGMQGYLFELDDTLANTFLNDIMMRNPGWHI